MTATTAEEFLRAYTEQHGFLVAAWQALEVVCSGLDRKGVKCPDCQREVWNEGHAPLCGLWTVTTGLRAKLGRK